MLHTINFSYWYDNFVDVTIVGGNNEHTSFCGVKRNQYTQSKLLLVKHFLFPMLICYRLNTRQIHSDYNQMRETRVTAFHLQLWFQYKINVIEVDNVWPIITETPQLTQ